MGKFIQIIRDKYNTLNAAQKRRLALVCTGIFSLILALSVIIPLRLPAKEKKTSGPETISVFAPIPPVELFIPDEPDYVPLVILEREQRTSWTAQDADEYWQDPLIFGEERQREKIEAAIDEILERVP